MSSTTLAAVLAKLAGLSLPAKAAGVAVAIGVIGGVPAAAHAVGTPHVRVAVDETPAPTASSTDGTSTGARDDEQGDSQGEATEDPASQPTATDAPTAGPTPAPTHTLPASAAFGQRVAADARDGGVDGHQISQEARAKSASATGLAHRHGAQAPGRTAKPAPTAQPTPEVRPTLPAPAETHPGNDD
ncbi:hypothetical protein [Cellulomonas alba]|uniref:Uncharacterized protein n=1 Tax=Cellulomonas alba TaxID=3053467 RepID=A0ABT7SG36_9CELL|nr:hypothetical protein [Cellulomonas alba]MDM7855138.1 hypothetical protein [Cellulomonas alba]